MTSQLPHSYAENGTISHLNNSAAAVLGTPGRVTSKGLAPMLNKRTIPCVCETCGKHFLASTSSYNRNGGKYCSLLCSNRRHKHTRPHTPNEYRIDGDVAYLALTDRKGVVIAETLVDTDRLDDVLRFRWALNSTGYVTCSRVVDGRNVHLALHRFITGLERGDRRMIDHDNRNRLDNRIANLKIATAAINAKNKVTPAASRYPGVTWDKENQRWRVSFWRQGKSYWLGRYDTEEEAGRVAMEFSRTYPPSK